MEYKKIENSSVQTSIQVLKKEDVPSFLNTKLDLGKLAKSLEKSAKVAAETLVTLLNSQDEKTKLSAAVKLLELNVSVAKEINDDSLRRLIAEMRRVENSKKLVKDNDSDEGKAERPLVDFTTIREIE